MEKEIYMIVDKEKDDEPSIFEKISNKISTKKVIFKKLDSLSDNEFKQYVASHLVANLTTHDNKIIPICIES